MKQKICVIGGTVLLNTRLSSFKQIKIKNIFGQATIFQRGNIFFIQRHLGDLPPRSINFQAYFQALADKGIEKIISFNSTGALRKNIKVPSLMMPNDFISFLAGPTFFDKEIKHTTPVISENLRKEILKICQASGVDVCQKGIYLETPGPRFETAAEIRMFSQFADVVGMTLANEVILANEIGVEIASVCAVDNYANGISGHLDYKIGVEKNLKKVESIINNIIQIYD